MASSNKRNQRSKLKRKQANLERQRNQVTKENKTVHAKVKYIRDGAGTLIMITQHPNGQLVERAPEHMQ